LHLDVMLAYLTRKHAARTKSRYAPLMIQVISTEHTSHDHLLSESGYLQGRGSLSTVFANVPREATNKPLVVDPANEIPRSDDGFRWPWHAPHDGTPNEGPMSH
jgi:hypothetical protein